jgi:hypothetical protein
VSDARGYQSWPGKPGGCDTEAGLGQLQLKAANVVGGRRVGEATEERREALAAMDVAALRMGPQLACGYVLDHAPTPWTHGGMVELGYVDCSLAKLQRILRAVCCTKSPGDRAQSVLHARAFPPRSSSTTGCHRLPKLMLPALQVNLLNVRVPEPKNNGKRYIKIPLNALNGRRVECVRCARMI